MSGKNDARPRWGLLYLVLPLAALLFWLIDRAHPSDVMRRLVQIGAVLLVFGYVDVWRVANAASLLHQSVEDRQGEPLYGAREASAGNETGTAAAAGPYEDLFAAPVRVVEPSPPVMDHPHTEETR